MNRLVTFFLPLLLASLVLCPVGATAAVDGLKVYRTKLSQPGWLQSGAFDINDRGDVVGVAISSTFSRGFLNKGGTNTYIIPPGWTSSSAEAISENGLVAGEGVGGPREIFLYNAGTYTNVDHPGMTDLSVYGVNNSGQIVGTGFDGGTYRGFLADSGGFTQLLPPGWTSVSRMFINNSGHMAGTGYDGVNDASFYMNGAPEFVGPPGWTNISLAGLNDNDDIAGNGDDGTMDKCFLRRNGTYEIISHPDWFGSQCISLNNNGDVIGLGIKGPMSFIFFLYRDGHFYELGSGLEYFIPSAFNSHYEIAGYAQFLPSTVKAVVLSVLPSPDLTAGGKDGPVGAGPAGISKLKLSMLAWTFKGRSVEWWMVVSTPGGIYSYDPFAGSWSPGLRPAVRMPLRDIRGARFPAAPAAGPGIYTYYLGVDPFLNGRIDPAVWFTDILTVIRRKI